MRNTTLAAALVLACAALAPASQAARSYQNCTGFINSVPAVISTQGTWCMNKDLASASTSGALVTIATNNVTVDCNDFKLGGLAAGPGTNAVGMLANERRNVTVRHCNLRGFQVGVALSGPGGESGHVVEHSRFDGNTYAGILVQGDNSLVRDNLVIDTGGAVPSSGAAYGIIVADDVDVVGNTVGGVAAAADGEGNATSVGINAQDSGGRIHGNRVRGLQALGLGETVGIWSFANALTSLTDNQVVGPPGGAGATGLLCEDARARAKDNLVLDFALPIVGCADAGNTIAPVVVE